MFLTRKKNSLTIEFRIVHFIITHEAMKKLLKKIISLIGLNFHFKAILAFSKLSAPITSLLSPAK